MSRNTVIEFRAYNPIVQEIFEGVLSHFFFFSISLQVGYPNVGKSSTINTLLNDKKVPVSATPGRTKHFQVLILALRSIIRLLPVPPIFIRFQCNNYRKLGTINCCIYNIEIIS